MKFYLALLILTLSGSVWAQDLEDLEGLLEQPASESNIPAPRDARELNTGISDLSSLEAFEDIAVIQKRFLPKTKRFEGSVALGTVTNDPFFSSYNLLARLGYYFTEAYGIEANLFGFTHSNAQVTDDLFKKQGVSTRGVVKPKMYYGLDFKWNPIYGKMTLFNNHIIPFDLFFTAGLGMTQIEFFDGSQEPTSAPTIHLGTGQVFALSKSTAFRWNFDINNFSVESEGETQSTNNLIISVGMQLFLSGG